MQRICDLCRVIDEAPRHITYHPAGAIPVDQEAVKAVLAADGLTADERAVILADVFDTADERHHLACGKSAGCTDCQEV
jgi:hypothetical protein